MKGAAIILASVLLLLGNNTSADTPVRPVLIGIYAQNYHGSVTWYSSNFGFKTTNEVVNDSANLRIGFWITVHSNWRYIPTSFLLLRQFG